MRDGTLSGDGTPTRLGKDGDCRTQGHCFEGGVNLNIKVGEDDMEPKFAAKAAKEICEELWGGKQQHQEETIIAAIITKNYWLQECEAAKPSNRKRFDKTYCSHCGGEFGPGDHGYSHCENHAGLRRLD